MAACPTPIVQPLSNIVFRAGVPYSGTIDVVNCTDITIGNKPNWLTMTHVRTTIVGTTSTRRITLTGTPPTSGEFSLAFIARNKPLALICDETTLNYSNTYAVLPATATTQCTLSDIQPISSTVFSSGVGYNGTIVIDNSTSVRLTGLPTWLTVKANSTTPITGTNQFRTTIELVGTPTTVGQAFTIGVFAKNKPANVECTESSSTSYLNLTVTQAPPPPPCPTPVVNQLSPNIIKFGTSYNGTITVNNATSATIDALPRGLSATNRRVGNDIVFTITGTMTENIDYTIRVSASNTGSCVTQSVTNAIAATGKAEPPRCQVPTITTPLRPGVDSLNRTIVMRAGQPYNGTIVLRNATNASLTGLPSGLTFSGSANRDVYTISISGTVANNVAGQVFSLLVDAENTSSGCTASTAKGLNAGGGRVELGMCPTPTLVSGLSTSNFSFNLDITEKIVFANTTSVVINGLPSSLRYTILKVGTNLEVTITGMVTYSPTTLANYRITATMVNEIVSGAGACTRTAIENQQIGNLNFVMPKAEVSSTVNYNFYVDTPYVQHIVLTNANVSEVKGLPKGIQSVINLSYRSNLSLRDPLYVAPLMPPFDVPKIPATTANNSILTIWGYPDIPEQKTDINISYTELGSKVVKNMVTSGVKVINKCSYPRIVRTNQRIQATSEILTRTPINRNPNININNYPSIKEQQITVNYDKYFDDPIMGTSYNGYLVVENVTTLTAGNTPVGTTLYRRTSQQPSSVKSVDPNLNFVIHPGLSVSFEGITNNKYYFGIRGTPEISPSTIVCPTQACSNVFNWDAAGKLVMNTSLAKPANNCFPTAASTANSINTPRINSGDIVVGGFANTQTIHARVIARAGMPDPVVAPTMILYRDSGDSFNNCPTNITFGQSFRACIFLKNCEITNASTLTNYGRIYAGNNRVEQNIFYNRGDYRNDNFLANRFLLPGLRIELLNPNYGTTNEPIYGYVISGTPVRPFNSEHTVNIDFQNSTFTCYLGVHSTNFGSNSGCVQRPYTFEIKFNITNL